MSGGQRLPRLLSVRAVADQTTLPLSSVYDAVYRGDLPVVRIGRSVRIDERDVVEFIAARKEPRQREPATASRFSASVAAMPETRARRGRGPHRRLPSQGR
jgi:excisionase family DNA binding protein